MKYIDPGRLFVQQQGTVNSVDDVLQYARFLRAEAGIDDEPPIDLSRVYARFHIKPPERVSLPGQQGLLVNPKRGRILINANDPVTRQLFSEAHELMEILFAALTTHPSWAARHVGQFRTDTKEKLCDEGAAELIMPRSSFVPRVRRMGVSFQTGRFLASEYHVSLTAALVNLVRMAPGCHAVVLWRMKHKPTEVRAQIDEGQLSFLDDTSRQLSRPKLRVEWAYGSPTAPFIPPNKSIPTDSSIVQAWQEDMFTEAEEYLDLGAVRGQCRCENSPFNANDELQLMSLIHLPGDMDCHPLAS